MTLRSAGIITLVIAVLAAGAWWFTLRDNQLQQITQLTNDEHNEQLQATARQTQEATAREELPELQMQLNATQSDLQALKDRIPEGIDFTPLMLLINNLTDQHLLQHDGITENSRVQRTDSVYSVNYTLNTTGSFNDQMQFISELQSQPRLLSVRSVRMTSREGASPNEPLITLSMSLQTFTRGVLPTPAEPDEE